MIRIILFFLFSAGCLFAEINIDSIENEARKLNREQRSRFYNSAAHDLITKNPDKALLFCNKAYDLAKSINDHEEMANSLTNIGYANEMLGNFDISLNKYLQSLHILDSLGMAGAKAEVYNGMGSVYHSLGIYDKALENYLHSLDLYEKIKDSLGIAYLYNNISHIYRKIGKPHQALENYFTSIEILKRMERESDLSAPLNNIGLIYYDLGNNRLQKDSIKSARQYYDKALNNFRKALEISEKHNDELGIAGTINNMGLVFLKFKEYDKALDYCMRALKIKEKHGDKSGVVNCMNDIGKIYLEMGNHTKAVNWLTRSLDLARKLKVRQIEMNIHYNLSEAYEKKGHRNKALEHYKEYIHLKDNLYDKEHTKRIEEMKIRYETAKIERQNRALLKEKEIQHLELSKQRNWIIFLTVLFIFAVFIALIAYKYYKLKKSENDKLRQMNETIKSQNRQLNDLLAMKDRFFSIIAHDLKNPLSAFMNVSQMMKESYDNFTDEEKKEVISDFAEQSKLIFALLENLLEWSRLQTDRINFDPQKINLNFIIENALNLMAMNASKKNIELETDLGRKTMAYADPNMITTVIRNLISNSIKFTPAGGKIKVTTEDLNNKVQITVKDTGIGIPEKNLEKLFRLDAGLTTEGTDNEKGTGLGLILCKEFVEKNGGEIKVESKTGEGTSFIFTLPKN